MEFLIYLAKVNIAIVLLYFLYKLAFQHDTMFALKRVILLFSLAFVFVYPLIDIFAEWITALNRNEVLPVFDLTALILNTQPEAVVYGAITETASPLSFAQIAIIALTVLYFIGVAFCVMKFITQIISISQIIFSARKTNVNGVDVLVSNREISPFSFFGKIIISEKTYADAELNEILLHEQTHVQQWHSVDVILSELLCAFAWFNPAAWQLKREIRLNLEYLADGAVIANGCDVARYQLNLVRLSYQKIELTITNNFNFTFLKKRILMMQKMKTPKIGLAKYLLIVPVAFALMFLSTAATSAYFNVEEVAVVDTVETVEAVEVVQNDDPIFEVVDQVPQFPGGAAAMNQWLSQNIRYPVEAQEQNIQGRVMVAFVVERDGSISDVQVVRGVDPSLDREAVRVVNAMPNWQPAMHGGQAVRVRFTVPLTFRLQSHPATPATPPATTVASDEIFVVVEQMPSFPGGAAALNRWLSDNLRYPVEAREQNIQGRVMVAFVVERDGSISDVQVVRGVDPSLDREAVRLVQSMPNWQPGMQRGQAVRVRFTQPVNFRLTTTD